MSDEARAIGGRGLWDLLLKNNTKNKDLGLCMRWVLDSVIVDLIANKIADDDEFARAIGARIALAFDTVGISPEDLERAA